MTVINATILYAKNDTHNHFVGVSYMLADNENYKTDSNILRGR